jgi:hypothetical protein
MIQKIEGVIIEVAMKKVVQEEMSGGRCSPDR